MSGVRYITILTRRTQITLIRFVKNQTVSGRTGNGIRLIAGYGTCLSGGTRACVIIRRPLRSGTPIGRRHIYGSAQCASRPALSIQRNHCKKCQQTKNSRATVLKRRKVHPSMNTILFTPPHPRISCSRTRCHKRHRFRTRRCCSRRECCRLSRYRLRCGNRRCNRRRPRQSCSQRCKGEFNNRAWQHIRRVCRTVALRSARCVGQTVLRSLVTNFERRIHDAIATTTDCTIGTAGCIGRCRVFCAVIALFRSIENAIAAIGGNDKAWIRGSECARRKHVGRCVAQIGHITRSKWREVTIMRNTNNTRHDHGGITRCFACTAEIRSAVRTFIASASLRSWNLWSSTEHSCRRRHSPKCQTTSVGTNHGRIGGNERRFTILA